MGNIITALRLGDLMEAEELTWQAAALFGVLICLGIASVAYVAGKALKVWRDALK